MIDFHTHILPCIDDGSKSTEESMKMLEALKHQGVDTVALTPHFYANRMSVDEFLQRREESFKSLKPEGINTLLGAEVRYFSGLSKMDGLLKLRLEGTKAILIEMPFAKWSELDLKEIISLACDKDYVVVLAHIERYLPFQDFKDIEYLIDNGVYIQSNAEFFISPLSRRKALRLLSQGYIHLLASDSHNLGARAPNIKDALDIITKKLGSELKEEFCKRSDTLIKEWSL